MLPLLRILQIPRIKESFFIGKLGRATDTTSTGIRRLVILPLADWPGYVWMAEL
jgi:hypothetical protein